MNLNRPLQLRILQTLKESYPEHSAIFNQRFGSDPDFIPNLHYLKGHGLVTGIEAKTHTSAGQLVNVRITETGLDFLEEDGGIGSILHTVTVRLDADQLRQILVAKVQALSIPEEKKASALEKIRNLPTEFLNNLIMRVIDKGIDRFPELLMDFLQSGSSGSPGGIPPGIVV
ncbi:MAG: hypothetical protein CAF42_010160 [Nitrospira sp. CG24B]|nr:MAG: hypothetical protein CAF42_010160 [Nitrospira sp. CG24B]